MIARLQGTLIEKVPTHVIINVAGVGYEALISLSTYQRLPATGTAVELTIHTHVREDEITLFGFADAQEKKIFQKLIRVNGIGPRLAMSILSGIAAQELIEALATEDLLRLTSIPGIGKKTAERMIVDLKDKLMELRLPAAQQEAGAATPAHFREDLLSVLVNLGYKRNTAEQALREVPFDEGLKLEEAVRQTLRYLGDAHGQTTHR